MDIDYVKENKDVRHVHRTIDFTNVMPNFPEEGVIVASSDHTDQEHDHPIGYDKKSRVCSCYGTFFCNIGPGCT